MSYGKTIIVEDDNAIRASLEDICRDWMNVEPRVAASAGDGVELIMANLPAVVMLDLTLPDHDGAWVVEQVCARGAAGDVRFIVLSAQTAVGEKAGNLGAFAYLAKPFSLSDVIAILEQAGAR